MKEVIVSIYGAGHACSIEREGDGSFGVYADEHLEATCTMYRDAHIIFANRANLLMENIRKDILGE